MYKISVKPEICYIVTPLNELIYLSRPGRRIWWDGVGSYLEEVK